MIAATTETAMTTDAECGCRAGDTDLDRLIRRMSAHDAYGARPAAAFCLAEPADEGDDR